MHGREVSGSSWKVEGTDNSQPPYVMSREQQRATQQIPFLSCLAEGLLSWNTGAQ